MKRFTSLILACMLLLTLAACSKAPETTASAPGQMSTSVPQQTTTVATPTTAPSEPAQTANPVETQATTAPTEPATEPTVAPTEPTEAPTEPERQKAPDFTVYDLEGNLVKLSDFLGTPVVLNFWASWCGPCMAEMPSFQQVYDKYGQDVQFLIINLTDGSRETVETATAFLESKGFTFPVYFDKDYSAVDAYQINAIPATYFIDAEGYLVTDHVGSINFSRLQKYVKQLLEGNE